MRCIIAGKEEPMGRGFQGSRSRKYRPKCSVCGTEFDAASSLAQICSQECKLRRMREKNAAKKQAP